ncbi:hypothetical protein MM182_18650 [Aeromonas sp. MR19]|uniref:hypothetical protein n=1 Tax=Aeromonas sp. MR19 TaxID=2923421 RepID=UPI001F4AEE3D|nr:hypothetical protein [Aeromonas sp. MR19]MCH7377377.1 hypothetical protein [Aeromonas sp. MR19]
MKKDQELSNKIEELVHFHSQGGGFGDPDALKEHEWKIEQLKHERQMLISRKVERIEILSIVIAILSLLIGVFQVYQAFQ